MVTDTLTHKAKEKKAEAEKSTQEPGDNHEIPPWAIWEPQREQKASDRCSIRGSRDCMSPKLMANTKSQIMKV